MDLLLVEKTTVAKFDIGEREIYVKINWEKSENIVFEINIFDNDNIWSGCFNVDSAEECRKDVDESEEDYYKNVKMCLTNICNTYTYEFIVQETDSATFKWTKNFLGKNTKLVHGIVDLQKSTITESKKGLIDFLLNKTQLQKKQLEEYHENINNLNMEVEKLKTELTNLADIKNSLEDSLYGKFVTLINTKKRRIQALEDYLQKYEN